MEIKHTQLWFMHSHGESEWTNCNDVLKWYSEHVKEIIDGSPEGGIPAVTSLEDFVKGVRE